MQGKVPIGPVVFPGMGINAYPVRRERVAIKMLRSAAAVTAAVPLLADWRDLATAFRATPATVGGGIAIALLGVGAALLVAFRVGRDRRSAGTGAAEERTPPDRTAEPVALEFSPPGGLRPGQVGTLVDERVHLMDVTATIVDFAVRRLLQIREQPDGDWDLVQLGPPDPAFLPYERTLFDALFDDRHRVRLSELGGTFGSDFDRVRRQLYADTVAQAWYRRSPARTRVIAWIVAVLVLVNVAVATFILALFRLGLLGGGLLLGAVALLIAAGRLPARTAHGNATVARIKGFQQYLATVGVEQINAEEQARILPTYLPYAMVFGLTERWSGLFGRNATPLLYWYLGTQMAVAPFSQSLDGFVTTTAGAIASPSGGGSR